MPVPSRLGGRSPWDDGPRQSATLALLSFAMLIVSLDQYVVVVALPEHRTRPRLFRADAPVGHQRLRSDLGRIPPARRAYRGPARTTPHPGHRPRALRRSVARRGVTRPAPEMLLAARAFQGLGGALVFPTTLALINTTFAEGRARNRALGNLGRVGRGSLVCHRCAARRPSDAGVRLGSGLPRQRRLWPALRCCSPSSSFRRQSGKDAEGRTFDLPGALERHPRCHARRVRPRARPRMGLAFAEHPGGRSGRASCSGSESSSSSSGAAATRSCHPGCSPTPT